MFPFLTEIRTVRWNVNQQNQSNKRGKDEVLPNKFALHRLGQYNDLQIPNPKMRWLTTEQQRLASEIVSAGINQSVNRQMTSVLMYFYNSFVHALFLFYFTFYHIKMTYRIFFIIARIYKSHRWSRRKVCKQGSCLPEKYFKW